MSDLTENPLDTNVLALRAVRGQPLLMGDEVPRLRSPARWPANYQDAQRWHDRLIQAYAARNAPEAQHLETEITSNPRPQLTHNWFHDALNELQVVSLLYSAIHTQLSGALGRPSALAQHVGGINHITPREYPLISGHDPMALNFLLRAVHDVKDVSLNNALRHGRGADSLTDPRWHAALMEARLAQLQGAPLTGALARLSERPPKVDRHLLTKPHSTDESVLQCARIATALWSGHRVRGSLHRRIIQVPALSLSDQRTILNWSRSKAEIQPGYELLTRLHSFGLMMMTADLPRFAATIIHNGSHSHGLPVIRALLNDGQWDHAQGPHARQLTKVADTYLR